jgi:F-type H+-transporting ATPase subunit delta
MASNKVASRYAKALLDLSIEQKAIENVYADMIQLSELCNSNHDLELFIASPVIPGKKKIDIFNSMFENKMDKISTGFMALIVKNSRESLLPYIAESYIELYKKHNNLLDVYLTSAAPLEKSVKDAVIAKVKEIFTGEITLHETIDQSLIGGFVVKVDDKQIDASISSQLTNLKNILLN